WRCRTSTGRPASLPRWPTPGWRVNSGITPRDTRAGRRPRLKGTGSQPQPGREALPVVVAVAEEQLAGLRPLEIQVSVVLPGESDAAVDLDVLGGHVEEGLRSVRLYQRGYDRDLRRALGDSGGCVGDR